MSILLNFPNTWRLLNLRFVPFAAWLAGSNPSAADYPRLIVVGVPGNFAKAQAALPFLMDFYCLPHDLFQLYIPTSISSGKFDSMVIAMNLMVSALLGAGTLGGFLLVQRRRLLAAGAMMAVGTFITVMAMQLMLDASIDTAHHKDKMLRKIHTLHDVSSIIIHRDLSTLHTVGGKTASGRRSHAPGNAAICGLVMTRQTCTKQK
jgi:hypothetical protein